MYLMLSFYLKISDKTLLPKPSRKERERVNSIKRQISLLALEKPEKKISRIDLVILNFGITTVENGDMFAQDVSKSTKQANLRNSHSESQA